LILLALILDNCGRWDNVRKRIQWVKKKKDIEDYVDGYERVQPIKGYNV
jgi:hypothetical protein